MNELLQSLSLVAATAAGGLFSAIWEGALLALCVMAGLRLLPGLSAAARSVVWLNVFVLLLLLHFVPAFAVPQQTLTSGPPLHVDGRWSLAIGAVWVALSLWRSVELMIGCVHLWRLARRAVPVAADDGVQALLSATPGGRAAELCTSEEIARPSVLGFFRPRILVPPGLIANLTPQELQQVVLHEMEHLRRGDDWTNLLQKIGLVLFPLNPVLLWVERRLCSERELACDDRVMRSSAGRKAYALCLTRLAEYSILRRSFSLVLGAWERRPELVRRVHRILSQPVRSMGRKPAMVATGGLLAGALGCALVLAHSPELVSFAPAHALSSQAHPYGPLDPREVSRALGGTPQMVKATLPVQATSASDTVKPVRPAVLNQERRHRGLNRRGLGNRALDHSASLQSRSTPLPAVERRAVLVLTEITSQNRPRVVLAVSSEQRAPAVFMPATYAIVPTPQGWLIIQI